MSIRPSIIVGLGTAGTTVVQKVKKRISGFYDGQSIPMIAFWAMDTKAQRLVGMGEESLKDDEFTRLGNFKPEYYINREPFKNWLSPNIKLYTCTNGAGRKRMTGRLAYYAHYEEIKTKLGAKIKQVFSRRAEKKTELADSDSKITDDFTVHIHLISSLAGGTGSSVLLDFALLCHELIGDMNVILEGVFMLPECADSPPDERELQNTYATLMELSMAQFGGIHGINPFPGKLTRLNDGDPSPFGLQTPEGWLKCPSSPPYQRVFLVDRRRKGTFLDSFDDVAQLISEYLFCHVCTDIGPQFLGEWQNVSGNAERTLSKTTLPWDLQFISALGISRVGTREDQIMNFVAHKRTNEVIERLIGGSSGSISANTWREKVLENPIFKTERFLNELSRNNCPRIPAAGVSFRTPPVKIVEHYRSKSKEARERIKRRVDNTSRTVEEHIEDTESMVRNLVAQALETGEITVTSLIVALRELAEAIDEMKFKYQPPTAPPNDLLERTAQAIFHVTPLRKRKWHQLSSFEYYDTDQLARQANSLKEILEAEIIANFLA